MRISSMITGQDIARRRPHTYEGSLRIGGTAGSGAAPDAARRGEGAWTADVAWIDAMVVYGSVNEYAPRVLGGWCGGRGVAVGMVLKRYS